MEDTYRDQMREIEASAELTAHDVADWLFDVPHVSATTVTASSTMGLTRYIVAVRHGLTLVGLVDVFDVDARGTGDRIGAFTAAWQTCAS